MNEPSTFEELYIWLEEMYCAYSRHLFAKQYSPRNDNAGDVMLWFVPLDAKHAAALEQAAESIAIQGGGVFEDLQPEAALILKLRIEQASALIEGLWTIPETPFAFPDVSFRELTHWLLVEYWNQRRISRACRDLALRADFSPDED
jgi:hypothetical protein